MSEPTSPAPGTTVLVSGPDGKPVAFMQFLSPGITAIDGDVESARTTFASGMLFLHLRASGIINPDGSFVDKTREEGL